MSDGLDLDAYLARIGWGGSLAPDLTTLAALQDAHVRAIPFEGIDPLLGRPVSLELAAVQDKLVARRRGGYCFEQNTLFRAVLERVGFSVVGLAGRVRWMSPPDAPLGPRTHMLLQVETPEGPHLADVGFGACLIDQPLRFPVGVEQRTRLGTFQLRSRPRGCTSCAPGSRAAGAACMCSRSSRSCPPTTCWATGSPRPARCRRSPGP